MKALGATVFIALSLGGCYEADKPIAPASTRPLSAAAVGRWRCVAAEPDEPMILDVTAVSPTQYDLVQTAGAEKPDHYRAFTSSLGGVSLANVEEVADDGQPSKWVLARYTLHRPTILEIEIASDRVFKAAPAGADPQRIAAEHLKKGDRFEQYCVCVRVGEKKGP